MNLFLSFANRYVKRYGWWYFGGVVCILITQALMISVVELTKNAIDTVTAAGADSSTIIPFAFKIALIAPAIILVRIASRLLIFTPGRLSEYHIRNDYYASLLGLQRDFFSKHETGDLVSRCSNDIGFVRGAFGFGFLQVANVSVTLVFVIIAMFNMDARTTIYIAIPMIVSFAIIQLSIHYMFSFWREANIQLGNLSTLTLASYKGVSAIQNYHAEPSVESRFKTENNNYLKTLKTITKTRSFVIPLVQLVGYVSIFIVLWVVGGQVITGDLTLGQATAFIGYINMVMPPLLSLGWMLNVFNRAIPAIERLDEILLADPKLPTPVEGAAAKLSTPITLSAKNLGIQFPGKSEHEPGFKLSGVNLDLKPGGVIGVVGPVGSGKTALLDTLLRLNAVDSQQLYINGTDATHLDLADFRNHLSFTPQKALLFSTTLRNNLKTAILNPDLSQEEEEQKMMAALHCASFNLDPKQFPEGLETQVGEKGVMLSGGQRQRIALARSLLKQAEIYILDDVLSAVDHETEKAIIANIRAFAPGKSFIIASHRVSAVQWADEILVLEDGKVTDRGPHEDLINRPNFYRDIYQYQAQSEEEQSWS